MRKAIIKTAENMSEETCIYLCRGIREKMGDDIVFERVIDNSLVGGFLLNIDGIVYDMSIKTQLKRLKTHIAL